LSNKYCIEISWISQNFNWVYSTHWKSSST
jgi:hypothetical protein